MTDEVLRNGVQGDRPTPLYIEESTVIFPALEDPTIARAYTPQIELAELIARDVGNGSNQHSNDYHHQDLMEAVSLYDLPLFCDSGTSTSESPPLLPSPSLSRKPCELTARDEHLRPGSVSISPDGLLRKMIGDMDA